MSKYILLTKTLKQYGTSSFNNLILFDLKKMILSTWLCGVD